MTATATLSRKIDAMHTTLGVLIDDVHALDSKHDALIEEVRSLRVNLAQMDARIRKLERNGNAA